MSSQMKGDDNKVGKDNLVPQSYKGMTLEEARLFLRNIMEMFQSLAAMNDLKTMYEAGKQLSRLYFDCASHQQELAEMLLELEFPEYAIKTMKKLNNMGVFKNDDIWFSSFYFYNICWNYSDASFEFATALGLCGLPNLLNLNIGHKPYLDNLSSRNVYYLIKASLSIIHNICRYPGSCIYFRCEPVKTSLVNLIKREEDFIRVVASLCLASIVSENEPHLLSGGDGADGTEAAEDVMGNIINYVRKARSSDRSRFMGFRSHELLQGLRSATTVECERRHLVAMDGLALVKESVCASSSGVSVPGDEDVAECLEIMCNVSCSEDLRARLLEEGLGPDVVRPLTRHEHPRVRSAAQDYLWSIDQSVDHTTVTIVDNLDPGQPVPVYVSYASINRFAVLKIRDRLADSGLVVFTDPDDRTNADAVKKAIRRVAMVIMCVSEAYKSEPRHQLELQYCQRLAIPIVPLLIQQKYRPDGWVQRVLDRGLTVFDLSSKRDYEVCWETFTSSLAVKLKEMRSEHQQRQLEKRVKHEKMNDEDVERQRSTERHNCLEELSRSQHEPIPTTQMDCGYKRFNGAENNIDDSRGRPQVDTNSYSVAHTDRVDSVKDGDGASNEAWLLRHELSHLRSQLAWFDMNLLKYYKDIKTQAPEYFYQTLEKQLKLDFADTLKFSNAIDHLK